ncbi:MAG: hypothetical protein IPM29_28135 [Planctomycetes bacterium]|nr:hypothetical protein [Planctomycetota bacterium]
MAYDPARGRTMLFGGNWVITRYDDTWEFDGTSWAEVPVLARPPARMNHALATDSARSTVVLFGGFAASTLGDTWEYDGSIPTWRPLSPGTSPPARSRHAMAFDPRLGRVIAFGGLTPTTNNDTWLFDGLDWRQTGSTVVPPLRGVGAFAFDAISGKMLLLGGNTATGTAYTDAWELDGSTWTEIQPPHRPPAVGGRAYGYDSQRACFVGFGGHSGMNMKDETWEFDCRTRDWRQVFPAHAPPPRGAYGMAYDAARRRIVLFGGGTITNGTWLTLDDTWEYDGHDWRLVPTANRPEPRMARPVYDAGRGRVVLFGGQGLDTTGYPFAVGGTWEYDGADWTRIQIPEPSARWPNICYDPTRGRVVVFGGFYGSGGVFHALDDLWNYDGTAWTRLPDGGRPPAQFGSMFAYDPVHDRIVAVFGWLEGLGANSSVWELRSPAVPTFARYGLGCRGSNGVPSLDAAQGSVPALGGTLDLDVTNLPGVMGAFALGFGFDLVSFAGRPLPLDLGMFGIPGCDLWIAPEPPLTLLVGHLGARQELGFGIPNDPRLAGLRLSMQAIVFDPMAPNACASVSNAAIATIH